MFDGLKNPFAGMPEDGFAQGALKIDIAAYGAFRPDGRGRSVSSQDRSFWRPGEPKED